MADRMQLRGRTAVITGAGSGIGRALARSLTQRGCHVALVDVNAHTLAETVVSLPTGVHVCRARVFGSASP